MTINKISNTVSTDTCRKHELISQIDLKVMRSSDNNTGSAAINNKHITIDAHAERLTECKIDL